MRRAAVVIVVASLSMLVGAKAHAQVSIGIAIGQPPPPAPIYRLPAQPGPEFTWVDGYWYPQGHHYRWHDGYWTRAPFPDAYWVEPYYDGERYFAGYWENGQMRIEHDHHWDRDHDRRDYRRRDRDDRNERRHEDR